jgi:hypothetical protein
MTRISLLNLGTARWSFKPEVGVCQPFGRAQRWEIDAYANSHFFTDNTEYRGVELLKQRPLPRLEAHLSYSFNDAVWASVDTRYSFRGDTLVDRVNQNNAQQNFSVGSEVNVFLNPRNTVVLVFAKALVHQNGPSIGGFSVRYDYTWAGVTSNRASGAEEFVVDELVVELEARKVGVLRAPPGAAR